jgi:hypothetical protein
MPSRLRSIKTAETTALRRFFIMLPGEMTDKDPNEPSSSQSSPINLVRVDGSWLNWLGVLKKGLFQALRRIMPNHPALADLLREEPVFHWGQKPPARVNPLR